MARILLVDDDESVRNALEKRLRKLGHQVIVATDGLEALEHFRPDALDLVITDFRMPRMDGLDLMMRVKEQASSLPVLMITGTSTENPDVFIEKGAEAYLLKPVSKEELEATLGRLLQADPGP